MFDWRSYFESRPNLSSVRFWGLAIWCATVDWSRELFEIRVRMFGRQWNSKAVFGWPGHEQMVVAGTKSWNCRKLIKWRSNTVEVGIAHSWWLESGWQSEGFLFTLTNPHNFPARRFALKAKEKHQAVCCGSNRGPWFYGLIVYDNCNSNSGGGTGFWDGVYTNDTGLRGSTLFAGSNYFQVQEIEVFEVRD
jgi:hypothetical protein